MACAICKTRREKRHCPGIHGEICAICCGEQREETIDCPFDCEYLQAAREREAREKKDPAGMPNPDFRVSQEFLEKNVELIMIFQHALLVAALDSHAVDTDAKEALDGLVQTYKTLGSGLYYESRPANPLAGAMFDAVQKRIAEIRERENQRGVHKLTENQILTVLVFLGRMEYAFNNGRKKGRAFLDNVATSLAGFVDEQQPDPASLIVS